MPNNPVSPPLPADLPTNWVYGQTVGPNGTDVGLTQRHGYNYLMQAVNAVQNAANALGQALAALDADSVGAIPSTEKGQANGVASLDNTGKVPSAQLPAMDYDPAGSADAVQQALNTHTNNKQNPHGVTAAQVGAYTKAQTLQAATAALYGLGSDAVPDDAFWAAVVSNTGYVIVTTTDSSGEPVPGVPVLVDGEFVGDTGERGVARFSVPFGKHIIKVAKTLDLESVTPDSISVEVYSASSAKADFSCSLSLETRADITTSGIYGFSGRVSDFDICLIGAGGGGAASYATNNSYNMSSPGGGGGYVVNKNGLSSALYRAMQIDIGGEGLGGTITAQINASRSAGRSGGATQVKSIVTGGDAIKAEGGVGAGVKDGSSSYLENGGDGGSGGGGANSETRPYVAGDGGQDGSDGTGEGAYGADYGGKGQGSTTKAFGDPNEPAYSPGGGGAYTRYSTGGAGTAQEGGSPGDYRSGVSGTVAHKQTGTLYGAGGGGIAVGCSSGTTITAAPGVQGAALLKWRYK